MLTRRCTATGQDFREELRRLREQLRALIAKLDTAAVGEKPSPSFVDGITTELTALEDELARLQRLLRQWARAKYRGAQGTTILSNELRVQCEEMAVEARTKLPQLLTRAPATTG